MTGTGRAELQDLNEDVIDKLRTIGGEKFVAEMFDLFLKHVPGKVAAAVAGAAAGNFVEVKAAVHSVKSSAGNIGAEQVLDIARQIEALESSDVEMSLPPLIIELEAAFIILKKKIELFQEGTKA